MATRPARMVFVCHKKMLHFTHDIPSILFCKEREQDRRFFNTFWPTIKHIISQHNPEILRASNGNCYVCGSATVQAVASPMSLLHQASDPFVLFSCQPACNNPACVIRIQQENPKFTPNLEDLEDPARIIPWGVAIRDFAFVPCRVCNSSENTYKCSPGCDIAWYCGEEHQGLDWPNHKENCKGIDRSDEV